VALSLSAGGAVVCQSKDAQHNRNYSTREASLQEMFETFREAVASVAKGVAAAPTEAAAAIDDVIDGVAGFSLGGGPKGAEGAEGAEPTSPKALEGGICLLDKRKGKKAAKAAAAAV